MTARKKKLVTVYLDPSQDERLRALHAVTRVPMSVYIRDGIDMVLKLHAKQLLPAPAGQEAKTDE